MKRESGNVFEIGMLGLLLFAVVVIIIIGVFSPVSAQDSITVCRRQQETLQFEFRNMPLNYFVWNSDAPSWNYWAGGVAMDTEQGILIADPLGADADGYLAGTATLVIYGDTLLTVVGDAASSLCDSEPASAQPVDTCPAWAIDGATGGKVCLWLLPKAPVKQ